jgi:hypothetical protein
LNPPQIVTTVGIYATLLDRWIRTLVARANEKSGGR